MYTPFYYIAENSQPRNITDVLPVLLHCWAVRNLERLLKYTLYFYIAELILIL